MKYRLALSAGVVAAFLSAPSLAGSVMRDAMSAAASPSIPGDQCYGLYCTGKVSYFSFNANNAHVFYLESSDKDKLECSTGDGWFELTEGVNQKDVVSALLAAHMANARIVVEFEELSYPCRVETITILPERTLPKAQLQIQ